MFKTNNCLNMQYMKSQIKLSLTSEFVNNNFRKLNKIFKPNPWVFENPKYGKKFAAPPQKPPTWKSPQNSPN